jgi:hypothetical protein
MTNIHRRGFRPMNPSDIRSAARGLELHAKTDDELRELIKQHSEIDMFASKVIQEACERELDARWERRA